MRFDIARQPLIPAFLTLFALTAFTMCYGIGEPGVDLRNSSPEAMPLLGDLLNRFQSAYPVWTRVLCGVVILLTGMCTGRIGIRYNLYAVGSCLPIPLYGIVACGILIGGDYLVAFTASMLLAFAVKNYCRSFCNGYGFDAGFRASLYLGVLPLVYPPATPLVLILPLALLLFQRTLREVVVAVGGLLLPISVVCYVSWGAGGGFTAPLDTLYETVAGGGLFQIFARLPVFSLAMLVSIVLLTLAAAFFFLFDFYAAGSKSRVVLIFIIGVLLLTLALFLFPAITSEAFALLAVPAAILMPVFFVRIDRRIALPVYVLLLAATVTIITIK